MFIVTYVCILTSSRSTSRYRSASQQLERFPTPRACARSHNFGRPFSPDHFRREFARWVSCYALFKWWLPLSQHPHCLCKLTSFSTERPLGTLDGGLGFFPLDDRAYPLPSDCQVILRGIRSLVEFSTQLWALAHSVLYPHASTPDAIPQYISERTSYHGV